MKVKMIKQLNKIKSKIKLGNGQVANLIKEGCKKGVLNVLIFNRKNYHTINDKYISIYKEKCSIISFLEKINRRLKNNHVKRNFQFQYMERYSFVDREAWCNFRGNKMNKVKNIFQKDVII